jgi:hypothetical protein
MLALKGAELDLRRVISKDEAVTKSVRDSLVSLIDSLYAQGLKFDIKIDTNVVVENKELKEKLASLRKRMEELNKKIKELPPPEKKPEIIEEKVPELTKLQSPIAITQTFIQNTWNKTKNNGNIPVQIVDPVKGNAIITTILPGEEKKFDLENQKEVLIKYGSQEDIIRVLPNRPPEVKIERVTTKMNSSEIYVQDLQKVTVFTVTIIDERPEQLKISHNGPVSVYGPIVDTKGNRVYNVSLKLASTASQFDDWENKYGDLQKTEGRYKVNFFFTVYDEKTKDKIQVGDSFYFTDFSRN